MITFISCQLQKSIEDDGNPGTLLDLKSVCSVKLINCKLTNQSGMNLLIRSIGLQDERNVCFIAESCNFYGFSSFAQGNLTILKLINCILDSFNKTAISVEDCKEIFIKKSNFTRSGGGIEILINKQHFELLNLSILECRFVNNKGAGLSIDSIITETPCLNAEVTHSFFEDLSEAIKLKHVHFLSLIVGHCKFSQIRGNAIKIEGSKNYKVICSEFKGINGTGINIFGGNGSIEKCSFEEGITAISVFGELQSKPRKNDFNIPNQFNSLRSFKMNLQLPTKPSVDLVRCHISKQIGSGIEVTDTTNIICSVLSNVVTECLNGIIIRDFEMGNLGVLQTSRSIEGESSHHPLLSPEGNHKAAEVVDPSIELGDNLIEKNRGNGIKLENVATFVHLYGGHIQDNKDFAIGVVGRIERCLRIEDTGLKKVSIVGKVKEISHEALDEEQNQCALL